MKLKIPGTWSANRISTAVLASVLAFTSGAAALIAFKPSTSVQHLLSGGAYVIDTVNDSYVHVNTATGKPDLRGFLTGITDITQQDGQAVLYTEDGAVPISRRTGLTGEIIERESADRGFTVIETGVAPATDFYTVLKSANWVQRQKPQTSNRIQFKTKITPLIGGRDGTLVVVKPKTAEIATVFSGKLKKTISFGSSESGVARLTAGRVDGKAVVVDPASGKIVVFKDGNVVRSVELGLTGEAKVSTDSETGELVLISAPTQGAKRLLAVDVDTGAVREVPLPDGALDNATAPPLVTPGAIYLYNKDDGPKTLVAFDSKSGVKLSSADKFKELPRDAHVEVVDGSVIVDSRGGDDAWVISGPDRIDKVDKNDKSIPEVNKNPNPPTTTTPPPVDSQNRNKKPPPRIVVTPGAPTLEGIAGDKSANLTWTPGDSGGGVIQVYRLTCDPDCGNNQKSIEVPAASQASTVAGLDNQKTYKFTIAARNDAPGNGWSPESNEVTVDPTGNIPRKPDDVKVVDAHKGTLELSWTPNNKGIDLSKVAITGYRIFSVKGASVTACGTAAVPASPVTLSRSSCWDFDDDDNADVSFVVKTLGIITEEGTPQEALSLASDASKPIDPYRAPAAPGVTVVPFDKGKVTVTVKAGLTADRPVHYELKASGVTGTGTPDRLDTLNTPGNPFTVAGLADAPTGYTVDVTAVYNDTTLLSDNKSAATSKLVVPPSPPTVSVRLASNVWNSATVEVIASTGATCTDTGGRSNNCGSFTVTSTGSQNFSGDITATNLYGQTVTGNYNFTTPAAPPPPPPPSPSVLISQGTQLSVTGCSTSNCFRVNVAVSNMAGPYTVSCFTEGQSGAFYSYTTSSATSATCVWGNWSYAPGTLYVTVNGVRSNNA